MQRPITSSADGEPDPLQPFVPIQDDLPVDHQALDDVPVGHDAALQEQYSGLPLDPHMMDASLRESGPSHDGRFPEAVYLSNPHQSVDHHLKMEYIDETAQLAPKKSKRVIDKYKVACTLCNSRKRKCHSNGATDFPCLLCTTLGLAKECVPYKHVGPKAPKASIACERCRTVKQKCPIVDGELGCSRCRNAGVECIIGQDRRRRSDQTQLLVPKGKKPRPIDSFTSTTFIHDSSHIPMSPPPVVPLLPVDDTQTDIPVQLENSFSSPPPSVVDPSLENLTTHGPTSGVVTTDPSLSRVLEHFRQNPPKFDDQVAVGNTQEGDDHDVPVSVMEEESTKVKVEEQPVVPSQPASAAAASSLLLLHRSGNSNEDSET